MKPRKTPSNFIAAKRNFTPVPFKIIADPLPADRYHSKLDRHKRYYYQDMLRSLAEAKRGSVLILENVKPYQQIVKAAAKIGYEIHFAEEDGKLYIQVLSQGNDN